MLVFSGLGCLLRMIFFFTISSIYDIILLLFKQTNDQNKTNCSFPVVVDLSGLKDVHAALFWNINPKFVFISAYQSLLLKSWADHLCNFNYQT